MPRRSRTHGPAALFLVVLGALLAAGCTPGLRTIQERPGDRAITTAGLWRSMIYAARTDEGVILVDLGWDSSGRDLRKVLSEIDAEPGDVVSVFLTHSHRDHIAAWPHVRHARFYMGAAEVPYFLGEETHQGVVPWLASVVASDRPAPDEVEIRPFPRDAAFVFGADTLRAFPVPGHTPGSAAYLFRDILFAGDALSYTPALGFQPAQGIYSDDRELARRELGALLEKVEPHRPLHVCTAHAECTDFASLLEEWDRDDENEAPVRSD